MVTIMMLFSFLVVLLEEDELAGERLWQSHGSFCCLHLTYAAGWWLLPLPFFFFFFSLWQWWAEDLLLPFLLRCRRRRLLLPVLGLLREDGVDRAGSRFPRFSLMDALSVVVELEEVERGEESYLSHILRRVVLFKHKMDL
jgi:hypothetical protein